MDESRATRGRPRVGDPDAIGLIALGLMAADGWAATTMDAIAVRAGISTPTLFRYFATKADLLWHGTDESARAFRTRVAQTRPEVPAAETLTGAYLGMLTADADHLERVRARVRIIARDAAAAEASWPKSEEWRGIVVELLADHVGAASDDLDIQVAGSMVWSALWTALTAWSLSDDPDPAAQIAVAARRIRALLHPSP